MYGWKARIGSISATPTDIFPYEFYRIIPEGITLMQTTLGIPIVLEKDLDEARKAIEHTARALAREGADVIILGAAPIVYFKGVGSDRALADEISAKVGVPTISNQTAMMDALKAHAVKRVLLVSPHDVATNEKMKVFLEGNGFKVVGMGGLDLIVNAEINRITRQKAYHLVRDTFNKYRGEKIEGILMPCANWPTSLLVATWEGELGVPVVTSNQAKIWSCLRALRLREDIKGFGSLLATKL
jgi:maleate isomerase